MNEDKPLTPTVSRTSSYPGDRLPVTVDESFEADGLLPNGCAEWRLKSVGLVLRSCGNYGVRWGQREDRWVAGSRCRHQLPPARQETSLGGDRLTRSSEPRSGGGDGALDSHGAKELSRAIRVEAGLPWPERSRRQTRLRLTRARVFSVAGFFSTERRRRRPSRAQREPARP